MCISPSFIWIQKGPGYEQIPVPCKSCWRCHANRVNDYVARCLCEASTSDSTCTVTLTYGPRDDLADQILTPRHFQEFIKRLRKAGHKVRYLVTGEYGTRKDRAHFHAILFFKGQAPEIPHKRNTHHNAWSDYDKRTGISTPRGFVWADWTVDDQTIRYVCKYLINPEKGKGWFSISKKPPLGAEFFEKRAREYIEAGVMPRSWEYRPPNGQNRPYLMSGATRRDFLLAILDGFGENIWSAAPDETLSEWVQKTKDKVTKWQHLKNLPFQEMTEFLEQFRSELDKRDEERSKMVTSELFREYQEREKMWEEKWRARQERIAAKRERLVALKQARRDARNQRRGGTSCA